METDTCLDYSLCCIEVFIHFIGTPPGKGVLFFSKFGGIALDIMAIWQAKDALGLCLSMVTYLILDRIGALFMICTFGVKPTKYYKEYVYYKTNRFKSIKDMERAQNNPNRAERDKKHKEKGLYALYYGSLFSTVDFCGRIWQSYAFAIKIHKTTPLYTNDEDDTKQQPQDIEMGQLPEGWRVAYTTDNKVYYQNETTKQTQWEKPTNDIEYRTGNKTKQYTVQTSSKKGSYIFSLACFYWVYTIICCGMTIVIMMFAAQYPKHFTVAMFLSFTSNQFGIVWHFWSIAKSVVSIFYAKAPCGKGCCNICCSGCLSFLCYIFALIYLVCIEFAIIYVSVV